MLYDIFKVESTVYNKQKASMLVLKINKSHNDGLRNKFQMELFNLMSKIIVKNINNYLKLTFNSPIKDQSFVSMEMQSEAFLIMTKCVEKFKMGKGWCFYFYFNKSLSRSFYKMYSQSLRDKTNFEKISENIIYRKPKHTNEHYSIDLLIEQMKLTEDEIIILNSKMLGQSKQNFLDENPSFGSTKYQKCNTRIKLIIQKLIQDGEL